MYCQKCGEYNADDARFCANCGEKLDRTAGGAETSDTGLTEPAPPFRDAGGAPHMDFSSFYSNGPVGNENLFGLIRRLLSSNLFRAAAVLLTVSVAAAFLNQLIVIFSDGLTLTINKIILQLRKQGIPLDPSLYGTIASAAKSGQIFGTVTNTLVGLIPCLGLLLLCYDAGVHGTERVKTRGMTILRVMSLIALILICIGAGLEAAAAVIFIVLMLAAAEAAAVAVILIPVLLLALAVMGFVVFYYAKLYMSINSLRSAMRTGIDDGRVSKFAAVMMIISGSLTAFSAFIGIVSQGFFTVGNPVTVLLGSAGSITGALAYIFLGSILIRYKNEAGLVRRA